MPWPMIPCFCFLFGSIIGSFLNVVIYRLPRGIPLGLSRSRCPHCGKVIASWENIPLLSWISLRGGCGGCGGKISLRYPLVEASVAIFAFLFAPETSYWEDMMPFLFYLACFSILLCLSLIDFDFQIIPDSLNIALAVLLAFFHPLKLPWDEKLLGAGIGLCFPLGVSWVFYRLKGKIGLGGGDIKLYAALGLGLLPAGILQNIFLSCFLGAVVGLLLIACKAIDKNSPIPFGPFIALTAGVQLFMPKYFSQFLSLIF